MRYVWLDLETTGLDPQTDRILEIALAVVERPFDEPRPESVTIYYKGGIENDFVFDMHTRSGLLSECRKAPRDVGHAEDWALSRLASADGGLLTLCGASIHFDLSFMRVHMPTLAARFSHRLFDVSAMGLLAESMGMPRVSRIATAHRAGPDILETWQRARDIRAWLESV